MIEIAKNIKIKKEITNLKSADVMKSDQSMRHITNIISQKNLIKSPKESIVSSKIADRHTQLTSDYNSPFNLMRKESVVECIIDDSNIKQNTKNVFGSKAYRPQLDKSTIKERVSNLIAGNTQLRSY